MDRRHNHRNGAVRFGYGVLSLNDSERRINPRSHLLLRWIFELMRDHRTFIAAMQAGGLSAMGVAACAGYECVRSWTQGAWAPWYGAGTVVVNTLVCAVALPRLLGGCFPLRTLYYFAPLALLAYAALFAPARAMRPLMHRLYLPPIPEDKPPPAPNLQEKMLKALIGLEEIPVKAVMRSRVEINAVPWNASAEELIAAFHRTGNSRLVVYDKP
ncbi:MAG: hypothetical protein NZ534_09395, partial [Bacteroidia bacterium]|nr:hypothetical protein [Bacteroidia bacterium]